MWLYRREIVTSHPPIHCPITPPPRNSAPRLNFCVEPSACHSTSAPCHPSWFKRWPSVRHTPRRTMGARSGERYTNGESMFHIGHIGIGDLILLQSVATLCVWNWVDFQVSNFPNLWIGSNCWLKPRLGSEDHRPAVITRNPGRFDVADSLEIWSNNIYIYNIHTKAWVWNHWRVDKCGAVRKQQLWLLYFFSAWAAFSGKYCWLLPWQDRCLDITFTQEQDYMGLSENRVYSQL